MEYTELEVWIESRKLANATYEMTKKFPKEELFAITNQLRRAAVSIPSNIAEGCGRRTTKDTLHFLHIARGSLYEIETQFYISLDQNYINNDDFKTIQVQIVLCKKLISGFITYFKKLENDQ